MTEDRTGRAPMAGPVLVTGATGYLGGRLAGRLIGAGTRVHCVVRPNSKRERLPAGVIPEVHDGTTEGLCRLVGAVRPTVVYHLAACFVARHHAADVESLVRDNVLFSTQLFEAMTHAGAHYLVNTGTAWEHPSDGRKGPAALYAATKQAAGAILTYYSDATPLRAVTLKLYDTYGPNDPREKLFAILCRASAAGERLAMSPGDQLLDLVHIDDVVDAFLVAAQRLARGDVAGHESYAVGSGQRYTLRQVVELYARATGRRVDVDWGGRPYREREVMVPWDGVPLPGWHARIPLAEGLRTLRIS